MTDVVKESLREWAVSAGGEGPKTWDEALKTQGELTAMLIRKAAGLPPELPPSEREEFLTKMRSGSGLQAIPQLGIILNRLNIENLEFKGELARVANLEVMEQRERAGERIQNAHAIEQVQLIMEKLGCSNEQAIELFQTERGKVLKKILEIKPNVSDGTRKLIETIVGNWHTRS